MKLRNVKLKNRKIRNKLTMIKIVKNISVWLKNIENKILHIKKRAAALPVIAAALFYKCVVLNKTEKAVLGLLIKDLDRTAGLQQR